MPYSPINLDSTKQRKIFCSSIIKAFIFRICFKHGRHLYSDFFQFFVIPDFCLKLVSKLIIITMFIMYLPFYLIIIIILPNLILLSFRQFVFPLKDSTYKSGDKSPFLLPLHFPLKKHMLFQDGNLEFS